MYSFSRAIIGRVVIADFVIAEVCIQVTKMCIKASLRNKISSDIEIKGFTMYNV